MLCILHTIAFISVLSILQSLFWLVGNHILYVGNNLKETRSLCGLMEENL
jgi:hypothetical protein